MAIDNLVFLTDGQGVAMARKANWIRSVGPGDTRDLVEVYVYGPTTRSDEGIVGRDLRVRPARLGPGEYTMVVSPDSIEEIA